MIVGQDLQTLILNLSDRMAQVETAHAARFDPPLLPAELAALRVITRSEPLRMSELARSIGLPPSSVTNLADKLVNRGLVQRTRPETNRRVVILTAKTGAHSIILDIKAEQVALCDELITGLAPDEAGLIRQLLTRLSGSQEPSPDGRQT